MEIQETRKYVSTLTKQTLDVDIKMTTMCCFWQTETLKKKKKDQKFLDKCLAIVSLSKSVRLYSAPGIAVINNSLSR